MLEKRVVRSVETSQHSSRGLSPALQPGRGLDVAVLIRIDRADTVGDASPVLGRGRQLEGGLEARNPAGNPSLRVARARAWGSSPGRGSRPEIPPPAVTNTLALALPGQEQGQGVLFATAGGLQSTVLALLSSPQALVLATLRGGSGQVSSLVLRFESSDSFPAHPSLVFGACQN